MAHPFTPTPSRQEHLDPLEPFLSPASPSRPPFSVAFPILPNSRACVLKQACVTIFNIVATYTFR